ncbi:CTP synthase C-terminal region-related (seleno)protein [Dawidia soli]|uniref:CTP synthase (glutamine hydrolyzing) n=1 Tax=Dawidia soli TaxID=2782352 RepID=A0AAP2DF06_9BACT|nr:hypothetical protein [Dawidia soli]MBT1690047.1 hypothetical protein [Dawidia soli]
MKPIHIALIGDFNEKKHTHLALNTCVEHCQGKLHFPVKTSWIPTTAIPDPAELLRDYNGLWITPGSPYVNDEAVYDVIRWARESNFPLLGTCGGFQYMVVEYARNVLGITDAAHEESDPGMEQLVIAKLSCSLKGQQEEVRITDKQSWLYRVLQREVITGYFNCAYGVNPAYTDRLHQHPFVFTAFSENGAVRGLELKDHRFFEGTLFQPPLESTPEAPNPLIMNFFEHCATPVVA